jgi:hypothetical protein
LIVLSLLEWLEICTHRSRLPHKFPEFPQIAQRRRPLIHVKPTGSVTDARLPQQQGDFAMSQHSLPRLACATLLVGLAASPAIWAQSKAAPPIDGVIGKLQSFDGKLLEVQTPSGVVHVAVKQPLITYKQVPSDLSHVASAPYIGVASAEQADGKQEAKQIFIFPAELRGAAEGSVLTDPPGATSHSRMTNGTIARPSHSRMTNGTVQQSGGTTLVVNYQDGAQTISVPPDVPVTLVAPQKVSFSQGDVVYATTQKLPDGTVETDKIFQFIPAAASH